MTGYCKRSFCAAPGFGRLALTVLILAIAACSGEEPMLQLAEGQEPYLRHCASCHGNQGQGRPPAFPPLAGSEWMELPSQALALIVLLGLRGEIEVAGRTYRGYMPPMQHISDEDIAQLLGFTEREWSGREPILSAVDIATIRGSFDGRQPPLDQKAGVLQALAELP